jgi:hypothetical protein
MKWKCYKCEDLSFTASLLFTDLNRVKMNRLGENAWIMDLSIQGGQI